MPLSEGLGGGSGGANLEEEKNWCFLSLKAEAKDYKQTPHFDHQRLTFWEFFFLRSNFFCQSLELKLDIGCEIRGCNDRP